MLRPRNDDYEASLPIPPDVLLVIEVADTGGSYDREVKVPIYAMAGITEVWLVDVPARTIEAYSQPGPQGYGAIRRCQPEDLIGPTALPECEIALQEVFRNR